MPEDARHLAGRVPAASAATATIASAAASAAPSSAPSPSEVAKAISAMARAGGTLPRGEKAGGQQQDAAAHRARGVGDGVPGSLPG